MTTHTAVAVAANSNGARLLNGLFREISIPRSAEMDMKLFDVEMKLLLVLFLVLPLVFVWPFNAVPQFGLRFGIYTWTKSLLITMGF
jgi:hypothetical protein